MRRNNCPSLRKRDERSGGSWNMPARTYVFAQDNTRRGGVNPPWQHLVKRDAWVAKSRHCQLCTLAEELKKQNML